MKKEQELPNLDYKYLQNETVEKPTLTYYPSGKIQSEKIVIDRDQYIKEVLYDEDGVIYKITNFRRDGYRLGEHNLQGEVVRSGLAFTYYQDGVVQSLRYYVNGKIHWVEKIFSSQGQLLESISYSKGKKSGPHTIYSKNNKVLSEINYKNNMPDGKAKYYYETGELKAEVYLKEGKKTGESKIYFHDGVMKIKENLENDERTGATETYYQSGGLKEKWNFKDGLPHNECLFYYSNGSLFAERNFNDGKEEGVSKYYHQNRKLKEEITYHNGEKDGPAREYDETGKLKREVVYQKGNVVKEEVHAVEAPKKVVVDDGVMTRRQKMQLALNYSILFVLSLLAIYAIYFFLIM